MESPGLLRRLTRTGRPLVEKAADAVLAQTSEGSPGPELTALHPADPRHVTLPTTAVADAGKAVVAASTLESMTHGFRLWV
jgi:hypothetical protein